MATTDLTTAAVPGNAIPAADHNNLVSALSGDFVGRDGSTKAVAAAQRLGTPTFPWGQAHIGTLFVNGEEIDASALGLGLSNSVLSGAKRTLSEMSDFIRAAGTSASFTLLATTTNLSLNIDNTATIFTADVVKSSLTVAPSTNNTCLVDESTFADQESTKYAGQGNTTLTVDAMGTEISSRIGQYVTMKGVTEYMLVYVKSATELVSAYRGFYYNSSAAPVVAEVLTNNDTLTLMSTAWVFAENNGTTVDVTYVSPIYDYTEPATPATGDYWYDMANETWKRYSGSAFVVINRILVGAAVIDSTNCVAARSFNFDKTIHTPEPVELKWTSNTVVSSVATDFNIGVYGDIIVNRKTPFQWDIATDLETAVTEAVSTIYYMYITGLGEPIISDKKFYDQRGDLGARYHPYEGWRCVGQIYNDASSDFDSNSISDFSGNHKERQVTFDVSSTWVKPLSGTYARVQVWGAGGGGANGATTPGGGGGGGSYVENIFLLSELGETETVTIGAGGAASSVGNNDATSGGSSSFGSHATAYGGGKGQLDAAGGGGGGLSSNTALRHNDRSGATAYAEGSGGDFDSDSSVAWPGHYTGGGGNNSAPGADSVYGGGGGTASTTGSEGVSVYGGDGGYRGQAGVAPAGGGGGNVASNAGGAGAAGRIIVTVW